MSERNAIIAGASGLVGNELLRQLLDDPKYSNVLILVRKKLPLEHPKLTQLEINFDNIAAQILPFPVQDAFCTLGTTIKKAGSREAFRKVDYDYVMAFGNCCKRNRVSKFLLVSAMGADSNSGIYYNRVKGDIENAIQQIDLPSVVILRPSLLMGKRKEFRLGERFAQAVIGASGFLFMGGLKKYKPIQAGKVASAMVAAAKANTGSIRILNSDEMQDAGSWN
ncbi:MAG: NAD(P)H-binding protein [Bacteroidetes bacterium]|nr:NAD(P)H-binding protein [Bacteroidota bacterium]